MKISLITGTRAEYGLLKPLIKLIHEASDLELQLIVTGMHLSPEFGMTINEINQDKFPIKKKIEIMLSSDTHIGISKSIGLGIISFSEIFDDLKPDLIIILGDRYEIFAAACAGMVGCFPIAHIHGGESTEGLIDEAIRHSITKMSHYHFVATEEYKKRVIQLGEHPHHVFNVGALGIENIKNTKLFDKKTLENDIDFRFGKRNLLITFHPITLEPDSSRIYMKNLLDSLSVQNETNLIFTYPNADTEGRELIKIINQFCRDHPHAKAFKSLGQKRYFSCIKYVDGVIGNSSSGLIEVPFFRKGTINIGNRQKGRLKSESVIDCEPNKKDILKAINLLFSETFQNNLKSVRNVYGEGDTSSSILTLIKSLKFNKSLLKKKFYEIK